MIGQTISHYRIIEKLGEGGMEVVYRATLRPIVVLLGWLELPKKQDREWAEPRSAGRLSVAQGDGRFARALGKGSGARG